MAQSLAELRKNKKKNLEDLSTKLNEAMGGGYKDPDEDKFWKPTRDESGNGFAIIRFLPPPKGENVPFIRMWDHGFKGRGGWYIEKCLSTIGQPDPVNEYNSELWNSVSDNDAPERQQARKQKRRLRFISNIYVVKDPGNPDNEGKVFLFSYGKSIFNKIKEKMEPEFDDEEAVDVFDFDEGANFRMKIRQVNGFPNYDKSVFDDSAPLSEDDDELEKIWESQYSLQELLDPKNFKSYDELKAKLYRVLGINSGNTNSGATTKNETSSKAEDDDIDMGKMLGEQSESEGETSPGPEEKSSAQTDDDQDDDLEFFRNLANN